MTHLTQTQRLPLGAITVHGLVDRFYAIAEQLRGAYAQYRTVRTLERLSPRQLDDIGLTRGDVEDMRVRFF
ncbi:MAG: DUF1127 domain-containing protein [Pseudomonadota bacterium]